MKRILRSIYGQKFGTVDDFRCLAEQGLISGFWGNQMAQDDALHLVHFDDFRGLTLSTSWGLLKGSDGGCANFALNGGLSGTALGTTGANAGVSMATNGVQISGGLNFQAQGAVATASNDLEFNCRVQVSATTGLCIFIGFTNQNSSLQMPIQGSGVGNGLTGNANDAVGVLYDTAMGTADWWLVGNKGGALATAQDAGSGPTASRYDQWAISIDQAGSATFFRSTQTGANGPMSQPAQVGVTMPNAVTPTVAVAPVIAAFSRTAASKNVIADYIYASMRRI